MFSYEVEDVVEPQYIYINTTHQIAIHFKNGDVVLSSPDQPSSYDVPHGIVFVPVRHEPKLPLLGKFPSFSFWAYILTMNSMQSDTTSIAKVVFRSETKPGFIALMKNTRRLFRSPTFSKEQSDPRIPSKKSTFCLEGLIHRICSTENKRSPMHLSPPRKTHDDRTNCSTLSARIVPAIPYNWHPSK